MIDIQNSVRANTPIREGDTVYGGATQWKIDTRFTMSSTPTGGCKVEDAVVYLNIFITLPKLQEMPGTRPNVLAEWERFLGALRAHELVHAQNGRYTANTLLKKMTGLKTPMSCSLTREAIETATSSLIERIGARDIVYDKQTQHGATQGAKLNLKIK